MVHDSSTKEGTHPTLQEDEATVRSELGGSLGEECPGTTVEVRTPGYVMYDFGFPERSHSYR